MTQTLVETLAGLVLLYVGGEALVRGASVVAIRLGVSPLVIGLTVVAFGTSAPELVVSLDAALAGANDISVGNIVGSNIANISLILGLTAMLRPSEVEAKIVRIHAPIMIASSLLLVAVLANGRASRFEGALLVVGLCVYTTFTFWEARRESPPVREEIAAAAPQRPLPGALGSALLLAGLVGVVAGGHVLVTAAVRLASGLGVSQATIGLTLVAVGTSLPELATSLVASLRRQGDIAIGNLVGSNIFNILGILGATAVVHPLGLGAITWIDLGAMVALACALGALIATRARVGRRTGAVLLLLFALYTGWLLG